MSDTDDGPPPLIEDGDDSLQTNSQVADGGVPSNSGGGADEQQGTQAGKKKKSRVRKRKLDESEILKQSEEMIRSLCEGVELESVSISSDPEGTQHKFWEKQPVPQFSDKHVEASAEWCGPLEPVDKEIRQTPLNLPPGFEWGLIDVNDDGQMKELYTLLNENYVEDDDAMFRFDYSVPFLRWALKPHGWTREFHLCIRKEGRIVGSITGMPSTLLVWRRPIKVVEIDFLCVHKTLRSKRLAPILIKEITRRVNLTGVFQAVFTAGRVLPKPVASCRYWHRSLNPKKLIEIGFSRLGPRMTMLRTVKLYKLPDAPQCKGLRRMLPKDVSQVTKLLKEYLESKALAPLMHEDDVRHWISNIDGVVYSYVIENENKEVTDFLSFYSLPSSVLNNPNHSTLNAAYALYNVANTVSLHQLMNDALILAAKQGFDVFNALDIMENESVFSDLKFGIGDGSLHYYLFNWRCPPIRPQHVGLVLL